MKKVFQSPLAEIISLRQDDILTLSVGADNGDGFVVDLDTLIE